MCTASWFYHSQGYSLYFNRDEKLTRSIAQRPAIVSTNSGYAIMPIDPDGGGTWLGVNSAGWTYALLNYYQGQTPAGSLTSRGVIVKQAVNCQNIGQIEFLFHSLPLKEFAPFSLLCLAPGHSNAQDKPPEQRDNSQSILLWRWTGNALHRLPATGLITSSSRYLEQARQARTRLAIRAGIVEDNQYRLAGPIHPTTGGFDTRDTEPSRVMTCEERHRTFHRSHESDCRVTSVCMHREDAHTVSLSEITVSKDAARFDYYDGAPCEVDNPVSLDLPLQQIPHSEQSANNLDFSLTFTRHLVNNAG